MGFLCPFKIVGREALYLLWPVFIVIFGFANILTGFLLGDSGAWSDAFEQGQVYLFAISVCAPFSATHILDIIVKIKNQLKINCVVIKGVSILINVIFIYVNISLWTGIHKNNIIIQLILLALTIIFSFYMFCTQGLDNHPDILESCNDKPYLAKEVGNMDKTLKGSKSNGIEGEGGLKL